MSKASIQEAISQFWAARLAGDGAALQDFLAAGAVFEIVGANAFADTQAVGPAAASAVVDRIIADFKFHSIEQRTAIIDGSQAAVANLVKVSFRGGPPVSTEVCDLWEFNAEGKATSLRQFADTDLLRRMMGQT